MQQMIFIADFIACNKICNTYHLYNTLELLMMGIVLPETCWACNKICNKYHLLHLVGILFTHNNDDARSKSLQTVKSIYWWIKYVKTIDSDCTWTVTLKVNNKSVIIQAPMGIIRQSVMCYNSCKLKVGKIYYFCLQ